ncbi:MAG: hypothetical protein ACYSW8_31315 [Planctomycetota bacterium]|jgi:hypothetical protein
MSTANLLTATEKSLEAVEEKLTEAQEVARANQLAWAESETAVVELQTEAAQIRAAIRALKGEAPEEPSAVSDVQPESGDSTPPPEEESPEEFEARLKREANRRAKEKREASPFPPCGSCGGILYESYQSMKGRNVPTIACEGCSSVKLR